MVVFAGQSSGKHATMTDAGHKSGTSLIHDFPTLLSQSPISFLILHWLNRTSFTCGKCSWGLSKGTSKIVDEDTVELVSSMIANFVSVVGLMRKFSV